MIKRFYSAESAIQFWHETNGSDSVGMASTRFTLKARRHMETDFSRGSGLSLVGLSGLPAHHYQQMIEFDDLGGHVAVMFGVEVTPLDGSFPETFDTKEALGYSVFLRQENVCQSVSNDLTNNMREIVKAESLEKKINSNQEED